jgi:hypothetical protein
MATRAMTIGLGENAAKAAPTNVKSALRRARRRVRVATAL